MQLHHLPVYSSKCTLLLPELPLNKMHPINYHKQKPILYCLQYILIYIHNLYSATTDSAGPYQMLYIQTCCHVPN